MIVNKPDNTNNINDLDLHTMLDTILDEDKITKTTELTIPITTSLLGPEDVNAKNKFFEYLGIPPDDYSDLYFTKEEIVILRRRLQFLSTGSAAALPLICAGVKCIFASRCPFIKIDEERKKLDANAKRCTPLSRSCLVELQLLNEWTRLYMEEYQVGEDSFTELVMVRELAEIEVMLWRLNNSLAKPEHASLLQTDIVAIDKHGNALTKTSISSIFEAKERLQNRKSRLIKLMVGDRQEKYRKEAALKLKDGGDPSSMAAKLRKELKQQLDQIQSNALSSGNGKEETAYSNSITADDIIAAEIEKTALSNITTSIGPNKQPEQPETKTKYENTEGMKSYNYNSPPDIIDLDNLIDNPFNKEE